MDTGETVLRQSHPSSASSSSALDRRPPPLPFAAHHQPQQPPQLPPQQQPPSRNSSYRDHPAGPMATATVLAPGASYHSQSSYGPTYPHPSGPSISNMISPTESRKQPEGTDTPPRQSLPSLSEVISGAKPGQLPPPGPPNIQQPGLPSPFVPAALHHSDADKNSPRVHHPTAFQRPEPLGPYSDSPRPPFNGRPGLPPVSDRRPSPPASYEVAPHHIPDAHKGPEPHQLNGGYAHQRPPPPSVPYAAGPLPPGQVPLPAYPISPRNTGPPVPGPYDPRAQGAHPEEQDYARARYEASNNRHFESWTYQETLNRIGASARTVFNFAEAYGRIASEQQGPHHIPERLPSEREMSDMLANAELLKRSLDQMRDLVQVSLQSERARDVAKAKSMYEEDQDMPMYNDGKPAYAMSSEVKKRRGRAAPPGRCHSCNRIDTPEWRRGPDGARTLCNACGLHYAKLERKKQTEARSIRPKPEDRM